MSDLQITDAKYHEWIDSHNFDNCKLNRKAYGQFLADYITGEYDGFVLNINGSWGTGKTEFLKRLYSELLERDHPVVYVDAWESDFSQSPLTVVTSELLNQLELFNTGIGSEEEAQKVKAFCGKALKGTLIGLAGIASAKLLNDSNIGMETIKELLQADSETFTKQLTKDYSEQIEAIENIRKSLGLLAEVLKTNYSAELPVVVLVDELDRCRPTYAIEMLEVIKHFFTTDNFVFVIATDTNQLCHSIRAVYGDDFDSHQYLKRFFDRKASLPEPDIESYILAANNDYSQYSNLMLFPSFIRNDDNDENFINKTIAHLAVGYDLKIRDVDQLINKIHSCLRYAVSAGEKQNKRQIIHFPALVIGLIEQDKSFKAFDERDNKTRVIAPLINKKVMIEHKFDLRTFIEISMNSVVYQVEFEQTHYGENIERYSLPSYQEFMSYVNVDDSCTELRQFGLNSYNAINQSLNDPQGHRYWMWSDLKKVIELAGNIE